MKSFVDFCRLVGVRLTPAQRVLVLVAFDGVEPRDLSGTERELARQLFGDVETISSIARAVVAIVAGARSGKTYLGALRILHLSLTVKLDRLAPGESAYAVICAPDLRLARQAFRYALGCIRACPQLAGLLENPTSDSFVLRRPDGRVVTIECLPATRGGSAVRGRSLVAFLCDEIAFFRDSDAVVNDRDIYQAAAPRIMAGGQLLVVSTPWAESGLLFELHRDEFGQPRSCVVVHAPTVVMRPSERARVEAEYARDPINAERELGAQFFSAGTGQFFDGQAIEDARDVGRVGPLAPDPNAGTAIAAMDLAFASDSSALVIIRQEGERSILVDWLERRPRKGQPLKPSEVLIEFAERAKLHGCRHIWGDGHYSESAREHLAQAKIQFRTTPGGQAGKVETYTRAQQALNERRVSLPDWPKLLQQFRDVQARPVSGGGMSITHPRRAGAGHGDVCAAAIVGLAHCRRASRREGAYSGPVDKNSWVGMHARTASTELVMTAEGIRSLPAGSPRPREPRARNQFSGSGGSGY
jgi:hypothetical protein